MSFTLAAISVEFHSIFNRWDRPPLLVRGEVGIPLELKQGMGPHLQMRWEKPGSSRAVVENSAFISSGGRDLWAPLHCMKGVKSHLEF